MTDITIAEKEILAAIDASREAILEDLVKLVRIPSLVGEEGPIQTHMEDCLRRAGMSVEKFEAVREQIAQHPGYVPTTGEYSGRPNVIGKCGGKAGRSIILNGHVDVVSPEPISAWRHDPWGAEIEDGRLYGRGAADMKGGIVAALSALEGIRRSGYRPVGTVIFESVIEEEAGGSGGTLACFMHGYTADAFLVNEPQSRIALTHVGVLYFRVRVLGVSAHAGLSHLGVNAIGKLNLIYDALMALDTERGNTIHYPPFEKGSGRSCHICIGTYRAGDWPSTVAGKAELEARISFVPGETQQQVRSLVEQTVQSAAAKDPWLRDHPPEVEWFGWRADPWTQESNHPFVETLRSATESVHGEPAEMIGKAAGMDTRFAGQFGVAAASYGVRGANIHGADEYVELDSVVQCAQVIALTVTRWCGLERA